MGEIIRIERRERWTTLDRRALDDVRLSYRARGVLAWLLSRPDDWQVRASALAGRRDDDDDGREGRDAIRTALRELADHGYLVRTKRQVDGGRWITESVLYEYPTEAGIPGVGRPTPGNPTVGDPGVIQNTETDELNTDTSAAADDAPSSAIAVRAEGQVDVLDGDRATELATARELCELLADHVGTLHDGAKRPTVTEAWVRDMDRMLRLDERDPAQVARAIAWVHGHDFWRSNVLSPRTLRVQYDRLVAVSIAERNRGNPRVRDHDGLLDPAPPREHVP